MFNFFMFLQIYFRLCYWPLIGKLCKCKKYLVSLYMTKKSCHFDPGFMTLVHLPSCKEAMAKSLVECCVSLFNTFRPTVRNF